MYRAIALALFLLFKLACVGHAATVPIVVPPGGTSQDFNASGGSSLTFSHTVESITNGGLVVCASREDNPASAITVTGVTFNGDAMTKIGEVTSTDPTFDIYVSLWFLVNPEEVTGNVIITYSGSSDGVFGTAMTMAGVAQSNPTNFATTPQNTTQPSIVTQLGLTNPDSMAVICTAHNRGDDEHVQGDGQFEREEIESAGPGVTHTLSMSTELSPGTHAPRPNFTTFFPAQNHITSGQIVAEILPGIPVAPIQTYYFSTSGNDANDCLSEVNACQTVAKMESIAFGGTGFVVGDEIRLKCGDDFADDWNMDNPTKFLGEPGRPIVITQYGTCNQTTSESCGKVGANCPRIDRFVLTETGGPVDTGWVTLEMIHVDRDPDINVNVFFRDVEGVTIRNLLLDGQGFDASGSPPILMNSETVLIEGNKIDEATRDYISFDDQGTSPIGDLIVRHNRFLGNQNNHHGAAPSTIVSLADTLENMHFYSNEVSGIIFNQGLGHGDMRNITVERYFSHDATIAAGSFGYSHFTDNSGTTDNGRWVHNISDVGVGGILESYSTSTSPASAQGPTYVANNTFIGSTGRPNGVFDNNLANLDVYNNIFMDRGASVNYEVEFRNNSLTACGTTVAKFDYNLAYKTTGGQSNNYRCENLGANGDLTWIIANSPFQDNGVECDPQFVAKASDDYTLASGSCAIGVGKDAENIGALQEITFTSAEVGNVDASTVVVQLDAYDDHTPLQTCTAGSWTVREDSTPVTVNSCTPTNYEQVWLALAAPASATKVYDLTWSAKAVYDSATIGVDSSYGSGHINGYIKAEATPQSITNNVASGVTCP